MRMWLLPLYQMCRKHLLGEHAEIHMLLGTIINGKKIQGFLDNGLISPFEIVGRHDALVREMKNRGYNHRSPLGLSQGQIDDLLFTKYGLHGNEDIVDTDVSRAVLSARCLDCMKLMEVDE